MNKIIVIFAIFVFNMNTFAKEKPKKKKGPPEGASLGIGHIYSKSEYSGVGHKHLIMPFFSYLKGDFSLFGLKAKYKFLRKNKFSLAGSLDPKFFSGGYEAKDSTDLAGMSERKGAVKAGIESELKLGPMKLSLELEKDVFKRYNGLTSLLKLSTDFPVSVFFKNVPFTMLGLSTGVKHYSNNYINYYYGVTQPEVLPKRNEYKINHDVFNLVFSSFLRMSLVPKKWTIMTIYSYEKLSDSIKRSPIVSEGAKSSFVAFINYKF